MRHTTKLVRRPRLGLIVASAAVGTLALPALASAAPTMSVLARGIDNPRQVALGPDGTVYVAAAGRAGRRCVGPRREQTCFGFTSRVIAVSPAGRARTVARNLLSIGGPDGAFAIGAHGVGVGPEGEVEAVLASGPPRDVRGLPRRIQRQAGDLVRVLPRPLTRLASIDSHEWANNVDGARRDRNSNPYALLVLEDRTIVADAGANAVFEVRDGDVSVLAVIRGPGRAQRVPSSLALGPDGAIYVGELADGAGRGRARVLRIPPEGGAPTTYASGFTTVTGVAFGPDGALYVTQLVTNPRRFETSGGAVVKVAGDGTRTTFARGLMFPQGAAVNADGDVFVSNFSVLPGRTPRRSPFRGAGGELVRISGL